jgi:hypothetical protein
MPTLETSPVTESKFKGFRVSDETHQRLQRLSTLTNRSMAGLVSRFAENFEATWRQRMSDDEWQRYLDEDISPAAARAIRERVGGDGLFPGYADAARAATGGRPPGFHG